MIGNTDDVNKAAKIYIEKGYYPIPIVGKSPAKHTTEEQEDGTSRKTSKGWEKLRLVEEDIDKIFNKKYLGISESTPLNISIVASKDNNLIDVDLDCQESRLLAPYFLPSTESIFGRKTSRDSHYLYYSKESKFKKYSFLIDPTDKKTETVLLEIRPLNGSRQTVFPPSLHKDTRELIKFSKHGNPSSYEYSKILLICDRLAVASLLAQYWEEGVRQELTLAITGTLLKLDWPEEEITSFIEAIILRFDDPKDKSTRLQGIKHTFKKFRNNKPVTGLTKLKELLPEQQYQKLKDWLGITQNEYPIIVRSNCLFYRRITSKGFSYEKITSFTMVALKSIHVPDEGEYIEVKINTETGREYNITFDPQSFDSGAKLKRTLSEKGGSRHTIYLGSDVHAQLIKGYLSLQSIEEVSGTSTSGFSIASNKIYFTTEEGSLTVDIETGKIRQDNSVAYINQTKTFCNLIHVPSPLNTQIKELLPQILDFNEPQIVQGILGWITATFFKSYFIKDKELGGFPILFLSGASSSGKSKTAQHIIYNIWGIDDPLKSFIEQKTFTVMKYMSCSENIPIVFDEAKLSRMNTQKQDIFSNLIRISYDNSEGSRGRKDQSMVHYRYCRPLVLCSETGITETAHKDRTVFLNFGVDNSQKHSKSFLSLRSTDLSILGRAILDKVLSTKPEEVEKKIKEVHNKIKEPYQDRPKVCLTTINFGLEIMSEILNKEISNSAIFNELKYHYYTDSEGADKGRKTSEVDKTLTSWCLMSKFSGEIAEARSYIHNSFLEKEVHYVISKGVLYLHIPSIFPLFRRWDRDYKHPGDMLDQATFITQIKNEPYFIETNKNKKFGKRPQRCLCLDIHKMISKGVDIYHPWIQDELSDKREEKNLGKKKKPETVMEK